MHRASLFLLVPLVGCSSVTDSPVRAPSADVASHASRTRDAARAAPTPIIRSIRVAPGVSLEVVDYGGRGDPVVLLAGSGNTAHVFTRFAHRFTDRFRVFALTRRGFGASSQPDGGYDTRTLSGDLLVVLDSLRLGKVHLVGHSIAGDEMTRLATDRPDRVRTLTYIDAAYDRVALGRLIAAYPFPAPPAPLPSELATVAGFTRYVQRVRGVAIPRDEILATYRFDANGAFAGEVTPPAIVAALIAGTESPDYTRVRVPALAIYAVPLDAGDVIPWLTPMSPEWDVAQLVFSAVFAPFYASQRAQFRERMVGATVVELPGANHYAFLSDPAAVVRAVRDFLQRNLP